MKRRCLFKSLASAPALTAVAEGKPPLEIVDSNVSLFRWPFRRLPLDETEKLVRKMRNLGIGSAMAGSFEGVFQRDLSAVNERLAGECAKFPELHAVGSINPTAPGWESDFSECVDSFEMKAVRLHPGYHGYELDVVSVSKLFAIAGKAGVVVQVVVALEDARTQNEIARVPDVDVSKLPGARECRVQLLNWKPRGSIPPDVFLDTARIDGTDGIAKLLETIPIDRILFGSHAPFLIPEAALIRAVHENRLEEQSMRDLLSGNADRVFRL